MRRSHKVMYFGLAAVFMMTMLSYDYAKSAEKEGWPKTVSIGAGTGATYYAIAGGLGTMMEKYLGVPGIPTQTSGSEMTARLMKSGELSMGFAPPDSAYDGYRGIGRYKSIGPVPMRAFLSDFPLVYNVTTLEGSGIKTWADLKGKKGYWYSRGSALQQILWPAMLAAYGLTEADLGPKLVFDKAEEWVDALKTGKVAYAGDCSWHPSARWTELSGTHPMKIIGCDEAVIAKIQKKYPWVFGAPFKAGIYKTITEDILEVGFSVVIVCHKDLPDDFIYQAVKMVYEHKDAFNTYHPACKLFSTQSVKRVDTLPYHPGAVKYYKEVGVWTKKEDARQAKLLAETGAKR
jgi:TRAP transporter TAXI family solute receptor